MRTPHHLMLATLLHHATLTRVGVGRPIRGDWEYLLWHVQR